MVVKSSDDAVGRELGKSDVQGSREAHGEMCLSLDGEENTSVTRGDVEAEGSGPSHRQG